MLHIKHSPCPKTAEKVTYVLTWLFQGANYLSPYGFGAMHRMHHAYADTEKDPHSPKYDKTLFAMIWRTKSNFTSINTRKQKMEARFTENLPDWDVFDKMAGSNISRSIWVILYVLFFIKFASTWWLWIFLPVILLMAPIHGAIINWVGHIYGYVNFKNKDTSKNIFPFDFLMMGEGYHNNHHKNSDSANFGGVRWHEIDPTYVIMKVLNKIGVIKFK